ncbi:glycerol-3-phosphate dehydrogenase, mitochondrial-like [Vanacampus margaritifer]
MKSKTQSTIEILRRPFKQVPHLLHHRARMREEKCAGMQKGQEFDVRAKCVINATGPFTNALGKMDDQKNADICQPGAGARIVIPGYYREKKRKKKKNKKRKKKKNNKRKIKNKKRKKKKDFLIF